MLDLFCGRWGWGRVFDSRGWEVIGVDLTHHADIQPRRSDFVQDDVLNITAQWIVNCGFTFVCVSSPCEQFSVFGMPHFFPNPKHPSRGIELFEHSRRICEASGVPYVMENVRAAQKFVGRAQHHCGPFYLWGTGVPPLMPQGISKGMGLHMRRDPITGKRILAGGRAFSSKSKQRKECTAKLAEIPPELANCVADYAEWLLENGNHGATAGRAAQSDGRVADPEAR